jgi:hypothetical protein
VTLDELNALAEAARAWRPEPRCRDLDSDLYDKDCGACPACLGAARAVARIGPFNVGWAMKYVELYLFRLELKDKPTDAEPYANRCAANRFADEAAMIAGFFGPEDTPVHAFKAAVKEFLK